MSNKKENNKFINKEIIHDLNSLKYEELNKNKQNIID